MFFGIRPGLCSWEGEGSRGCRTEEVLDSHSRPPLILLGLVFYSEQNKGCLNAPLCLQTWEPVAAPWTGGRELPSEGAGCPLDLSDCTNGPVTTSLGQDHTARSSWLNQVGPEGSQHTAALGWPPPAHGPAGQRGALPAASARLASAPSAWTVGGVGLLLKPRPVDASRKPSLVLISLERMQAAGSPSG